MLRWLPEYVGIQRANLELPRTRPVLLFEDVSADFSEERLGEFRAVGAEIHAGPVNQSLGSLKGTTAWKDGTILFRKHRPVGRGQARQLGSPTGAGRWCRARRSGDALWRLFAFRCFSHFRTGMMAVDSAVSASNIEVAPVAALLGYHADLEGVIARCEVYFSRRSGTRPRWPGFAADWRPTASD